MTQAATKAKNSKKIEKRIGADMGRFNPGTHKQGYQTLLQRDSELVCDIPVVDELKTCCDALKVCFVTIF